jgi:hypothetical protein
VDNGIKPLSSAAFAVWATAVLDSMGARNVESMSLDALLNTGGALGKALTTHESLYTDYAHARDLAEYWEAGVDLGKIMDARTFAVVALENYLSQGLSGAQSPLERAMMVADSGTVPANQSAEEQAINAYNKFVSILGAEAVDGTAAKILGGKKASYPDPGDAFASVLYDHPKALVLNVLKPGVTRPFTRLHFDAYDRAIAQYGEARVRKTAEILWKGRNASGGYGTSQEPLADWFEKLARDPDTKLPPPIPRFSASDIEGIRAAKLGFRDLLIVEGTPEGFREHYQEGLGDVVDVALKENPAIILRLRNVRADRTLENIMGRQKAIQGQFASGGKATWNKDTGRWEMGTDGTIVLWLFNQEIRALLAR